MDYATHGDLYTLWLVEGAFSESAARIYSAELAMVVDFLHNAGIVYRDLKVSQNQLVPVHFEVQSKSILRTSL